MRSFRWGIIGPGLIARKFAYCILALPNSKVQAIASRSSKNLQGLVSELHAEVGYRSYEELVQDKNIDAVYIATPHRFHYENALLCLNNNKPALIEKAFTVNALEAERLAAEAKNKGVFLNGSDVDTFSADLLPG